MLDLAVDYIKDLQRQYKVPNDHFEPKKKKTERQV